MAYTVKINAPVCAEPHCQKPATVQVFNKVNELIGARCARHGNELADKLSKGGD